MLDPHRSESAALPGGDIQRLLSLTGRGMVAVQEMLTVLRQRDREVLALAERVRELEQLVCCDRLTGLPNRRGLEEHVRREEARALRYGSPVAAVLLEIEGVGAVNDRYGQAAGDALLRAAAAALHAAARGSDVIARSAGDCFAALLPGAAFAGGQRFVERVRAIAQSAMLPTGVAIPIVPAAGIAGREEAGSLTAAFALAEQRLVQAKSAPRPGPPAG